MWNTVENSLQSCVSGKDAFPLCQMLTADSILFLKSLNAVDAASLSRNLKLIVAKKKHPFRQKGVVKLACKIIIFFVWHLGAGKSEIYVNNRLACNTVAAHLNSSTVVFVKAVQTAQTKWVENVCRHSVCLKVRSTDYFTDMTLKTKKSVQLLICSKTGFLAKKAFWEQCVWQLCSGSVLRAKHCCPCVASDHVWHWLEWRII